MSKEKGLLQKIDEGIEVFNNPDPNKKYYIGADYCKVNNSAHFCIMVNDVIEHQIVLLTNSDKDFDKFCLAISRYFNATLIKEIT